jgi:hypothetical protein
VHPLPFLDSQTERDVLGFARRKRHT